MGDDERPQKSDIGHSVGKTLIEDTGKSTGKPRKKWLEYRSSLFGEKKRRSLFRMMINLSVVDDFLYSSRNVETMAE